MLFYLSGEKLNKKGFLLAAGTLIGRVACELLCDVTGHAYQLEALTQRTISAQEICGAPIDTAAFSSELTQRLARWIFPNA